MYHKKGKSVQQPSNSSAFCGPLEQTNKVKTKLTADLESVFIVIQSEEVHLFSKRMLTSSCFFLNKASLRTFPLEQLRKEQENK